MMLSGVGLIGASNAAAESACAEHRKAISEAEEASGLKVNAGQR